MSIVDYGYFMGHGWHMDQPAAETLITIARASDLLNASPHQTALLAETGVLDTREIAGRLMVTTASVDQYQLRSQK